MRVHLIYCVASYTGHTKVDIEGVKGFLPNSNKKDYQNSLDEFHDNVKHSLHKLMDMA